MQLILNRYFICKITDNGYILEQKSCGEEYWTVRDQACSKRKPPRAKCNKKILKSTYIYIYTL